jgi:hypothetical protein
VLFGTIQGCLGNEPFVDFGAARHGHFVVLFV